MLAPWIIQHLPPHRQYIEPFGGGGSVLLRKAPSFTEVYNDLDEEVVTLFKIARERGDELRAALALTPFSRAEFERAYLRTSDPFEIARRCVVRSFMGFGSDGVHSCHRTGFRGHSERSGTTPAHDWKNLPAAFEAITDRLRGVVIERLDALDVIAKYDGPQALHYVDPPYVHSTRKRVDKARGYRHELTNADHCRLAEALHNVRGGVVLSGYACDLYDRELFSDWHRVERKAFADGALDRTEVLWLNPVAARALEPELFERRAA